MKYQKKYTDDDVINCWEHAKEIGEDTYFKYKGLMPPQNTRYGNNPNGFHSTMVKSTDINGLLRGFTSLNEKGKYNYLANEDENAVRFSSLGSLFDAEKLFIGEGIATVQTIWEAYDRKIPAVSAGGWFNILSVVKSIKQKYPNITLIVLIDLDEQGCGMKAARQVTEIFPESILISPNFEGLPNKADGKLKDFNDLVSKCGCSFMNVKEQVERKIELFVEIANVQNVVEDIPKEEKKDNVKFDYLLENNSEQKLIEELKSLSPGIETGYTIGDVDLKFPGGAISIIAAPTSHGKTTALVNFTLGVLEKNLDKSTYFFSYEECGALIFESFINTFINTKLLEQGLPSISKSSRNSVNYYYRAKVESEKYKYLTTEVSSFFDRYKQELFDSLIYTGKLRIFYFDKSTEELIESIRFIKQNTNVGAIFIDYIQLLKLQKITKSSRQEELKQICLKLKDVAIETGLPIILAAQFNRTVTTEADLSPVNIGEAGDIERVASLIVGMFNRNFQLQRDGNKNKEDTRIEKENSIYFEILKGRRIGNNHHCVMDFNGNAGIIKKNPKEEISPKAFGE